jgi:hypothetical protein
MKKVLFISVMFFGLTACHKQVIRPNNVSSDSETYTTKSASNDGAITEGTTETESPNPGDDGTTITDPLRKKNPKDNK